MIFPVHSDLAGMQDERLTFFSLRDAFRPWCLWVRPCVFTFYNVYPRQKVSKKGFFLVQLITLASPGQSRLTAARPSRCHPEEAFLTKDPVGAGRVYQNRPEIRTLSRVRDIRFAGTSSGHFAATSPPCGARKLLRAYASPCSFRPLRKKGHRFFCHRQRDGSFPRARGRLLDAKTPCPGQGVLTFYSTA